MYLFNILEQDAQTPTQEIVAKLHAIDPVLQVVNKTWVYRTLMKHDWTKKNVSFKQQLKFSMSNIRFGFVVLRLASKLPKFHVFALHSATVFSWYLDFVDFIKLVPLINLKYMDESHFASRGKILMLW